MRKRRLAIAAAVPAVVVLLLALMAPLAGASGTVYDVSNSSDCSALGGSLASTTCTLDDVNVAIGPNDALVVPVGYTLYLESSSLTNYGDAYVNGTLTIDCYSNFNNANYMTESDSSDTYVDGGTFTDSGSLYADGSFYVYGGFLYVVNDGYFENDNYLEIDYGGTVSVQYNAELSNYGEIDVDCNDLLNNDGWLYNQGLLYVFYGGNLTNYNYLENYYGGAIYIVCGGYFTNEGTSIYSPEFGGETYNYGFLTNGYDDEYYAGTIINNGFIYNEPYGAFYNWYPGLIVNPGFIGEFCLGSIWIPGEGLLTVNPVTYFDPCPPVLNGYSAGSGDTPTISGYLEDSPFSLVQPPLSAEGGFPALVNLTDVNNLLGEQGQVGVTTTASNGSGYWKITTSPLPAGVNELGGCTTNFQNYETCTPSSEPLVSITVVDPTTTGVTCTPTGLEVGLWTTCTAVVTDLHDSAKPTNPQGTVSWATGKVGQGVFSSSSCVLSNLGSDQAQCSVMFQPGLGSEGAISIGATYKPSPAYWLGSSGTFGIEAFKIATGTTESCSTPLIVNVPTSCGSTVTNQPSSNTIQSPGGTVALSTLGTGSGTFTGTCSLVATLGQASSSCTSNPTFTPSPGTGGDSVIIQANYGGDTNHNTSVGFSPTYYINYRASSTSVTCVPNPDAVNVATTCTATVSDATLLGTPITPTGTVTFSASAGGTFSATTCILSSGTCAVTFTPAPGTEGTTVITAVYGGDTSHTGSTGVFDLTVTKRTTSALVSCATPYYADSPIVCDVTVKDTSPGTPITPTGTATTHITGPKKYGHTDTCTLTGVAGTAFCTITFTPIHRGTYTLSLSYPGDTDHFGSTYTLTIKVT